MNASDLQIRDKDNKRFEKATGKFCPSKKRRRVCGEETRLKIWKILKTPWKIATWNIQGAFKKASDNSINTQQMSIGTMAFLGGQNIDTLSMILHKTKADYD